MKFKGTRMRFNGTRKRQKLCVYRRIVARLFERSIPMEPTAVMVKPKLADELLTSIKSSEDLFRPDGMFL